MPQNLRPTADISNPGGWTITGGATLAGVIDETSTDDADYIQGAAEPEEGRECTVALQSAADPNSSGLHRVWYRATRASAGSATLEVALLQGTTLVQAASAVQPASFTTQSFDLTTPNADAITDFGQLRLRFTQSMGSATVRVSQAWLEIPDPSLKRQLASLGAGR